MRLLQLYWPWRDEAELKHADNTYVSKFFEVKDKIDPLIKQYEPYDEITPEDLENAYALSSDEEDCMSEQDSDDDIDFFNADAVDDFDDQEAGTGSDYNVRSDHMDNDTFYQYCCQLNKKQRFIFSYIMWHTQQVLHNEKNDLEIPEPFYIFLSGGGGVGKSHTVHVINEYLKRHLKFKDQRQEQPSVQVCASTGVAAVKIGGTTLHSGYNIPCRQFSSDLSNARLHKLQMKYAHLKVAIEDEISMTSYPVWKLFEERLRQAKKSQQPYGGVSILAVGDFFQLPPVGYNDYRKFVFEDVEGSYDVFNEHIWKGKFKLHELTEIVRQQNDPEFAEVLSRVRLAEHTDEDIAFLKSLECQCCKLNCGYKCQCPCFCISDWPVAPIHLYITNRLKDLHNEKAIDSIGAKVYRIAAKDSCKDEATKRCNLQSIDMNKSISETGNLVSLLRICIGARVYITFNLDLNSRLVNGTIGTVAGIRVSETSLLKGEILVQFDDLEAGKSRRIRGGEFKGVTRIRAEAKTFTLKGKSDVTVTRKQYPLSLAHSVTMHKSQGQTYDYLVVDFNRSTQSGRGKAPINDGQAYTALSRGKESKKTKIYNFDPSIIRASDAVKEEMSRLRQTSLLASIWQHPIEKKSGVIFAYSNIRSWNKHVSHFLSDPIHLSKCDIFCFSETHIDADGPANSIQDISHEWSSVMEHTEHGLALCYKNTTIKFLKKLPTLGKVEMMACLLEIDCLPIIAIVVYRQASILATTFLSNLKEEMEALPSGYRRILSGDFNMDQLLQRNQDMVDQFALQMNMVQKVTYSTHDQGGIIDLIFDTNGHGGTCDWLPTPFSDHFVIYYDM